MKDIDIFRGSSITNDEERQAAINERYNELLQEEGDIILPEITKARQKGDKNQVKELQKKAKNRVALVTALEFGLIRAREPEITNLPFIPPIGDYDWDDSD